MAKNKKPSKDKEAGKQVGVPAAASPAPEVSTYPWDAVTTRDALLQGPDIILPQGHPVRVHGERDGLGVVSCEVGDVVRAGLMRTSAYQRV